jgi:hypothetical protein
MRSVAALLIVLASPALVAAEQARATPPGPSTTLPSIGLPLPTIGLPLPTIGLPLPAIGLPPVPDAEPVQSRHPRDGRPGRRGDGHKPRQSGTTIIFGSLYPFDQTFGTFGSVAQSDPQTIPAEPVTGWLRLDVQPEASLQVFVDDEFVGTPGDMGNVLELAAGARRLELRAPGHKSLVVNVRVIGGQTITYRGTLESIPLEAPPRTDSSSRPQPIAESDSKPKPKQTFYFIPGCYLGNVHPSEVKLPSGCDLTKLVTRTP